MDKETEKDNFGFKTRLCPPQVEGMRLFEEDLYKLIGGVSFHSVRDDLQDKMKADLQSIRQSTDVIIPADKTRNLYRMKPEQYKQLLHDNITKNYRAASEDEYKSINMDAQRIATSLRLGDRMDIMAKSDAYITLNDHKDNFSSSLPCRLINPAKSEVGMVSKRIMDKIIIIIIYSYFKGWSPQTVVFLRGTLDEIEEKERNLARDGEVRMTAGKLIQRSAARYWRE